MKLLALFLLVATALAAAIPDADAPDIQSKAVLAVGGLPKKTIVCGKVQHNAGQISKTANEALKHITAKTDVGANNYPHIYGYRDAGVTLASVCKKGDTLYEFPILGNGMYKNGDPGPDRIVLKGKLGKRDATYCGLMTHTGAGGNNFVSCSG